MSETNTNITMTKTGTIIKELNSFDDVFVNEEKSNKNKEELKQFMKLVMGMSPPQLFKVVNCQFTDNSGEPQLQRLSDEEIAEYSYKIIEIITSKGTKINGKDNNWSNGCFGSRWLDWYSRDNKTFCRVAFYYTPNKEQKYELYFGFEKLKEGTW